MKIIDRYLTREFAGPFLVGVGAFVGILLGVGELYHAVRMVVRQGLPVLLVLKTFLLRMPSVIALTLPMATVFAALMAAGGLSSHGEITAMRAGGISFWRLSAPILLAGLAVTGISFTFNEAVTPRCNSLANNMIHDYVTKVRREDRPLLLQIPDDQPAKLVLYADTFSPKNKSMSQVTLIEFSKTKGPEMYFAESARWRGQQWILEDVVHRWKTENGYREARSKETVYPIGKTPDELTRSRPQRPENYTVGELYAEISRLQTSNAGPELHATRIRELLQHLHLRFALPWAAVGFVLLGFPLGIRPQRTSTGVGFGISLAIIFVYYIVFNVLKALGEQGALSPALAAWTPNIIVFGIGIALMIEASR